MPISNYQTPGVYVTESTLPNVNAIPVNALNIAFFGYVPPANAPTNFYQDVFQTTTSGTPQTFTLTQSGVQSNTFVLYNNTTGYGISISGSNGAVASGYNASSATSISGTTTFTVSGLPANTWINAQYSYSTALFGTLYTFADYNSAQAVFGPAFSYVNGSPVVTSPNTLAAYLAFQNGAQVVSCMNIPTTNSGSTADFINAIYSTQTNESIDVIVPLKYDNAYSTAGGTNGTLFYGLSNYLNAQANNGIYQRSFIGLDGTVASGTQNLINTCQAITTNLNNTRVSLVAPQLVTYNPGLNSNTGTTTGVVNIDGLYLTAAVAGVFAGQTNVATPITNKAVNGFVGIPNQISTANSNTLQSYGTTVVRQDRYGNLTVRQGLTTNISSWLTQEISINAIADSLARLMTNSLNSSNLIGAPLTSNNVAALQSVVQATLSSAVRTGLIQNYTNVQYGQNPQNPTQINVSFTYSPTIPLNYIDVVMTIDSNTGTVSF